MHYRFLKKIKIIDLKVIANSGKPAFVFFYSPWYELPFLIDTKTVIFMNVI